MKNTEIRIEKYLGEAGIMSRREAKKAILEGQILVNGKKVKETGIKINPAKDKVEIAKEFKKELDQKETILVYKPRGVLSSKDTESKNIFKVFPKYKHLNCVGRLDKESEGLILLSNDGLVTKAVTGHDHVIEKIYEVEVRENFLPYMAKRMIKGIKLNDGIAKAVDAKKINKNKFSITLRTGRKHQIRRMANKLGLTVESLKRIQIDDLKIGRLKSGNSRRLTEKEIQNLKSKLK